jgi:general stress protein 26
MHATQHRSVQDLIKGHEVVGFITIGEDGMPNCRAMMTQEAEPDMDLWFATRMDSQKVDELRKNPKVGLYYYNQQDWSYVSIGGTVEVIQDRERFKRYWKDSWRRWFPKGPDDPEAVLLKVNAEVVTYEDGDEPVTFHP